MFTIIKAVAWFTLIPLHIMLSSTVSCSKEYIRPLQNSKSILVTNKDKYGDIWVTTFHFYNKPFGFFFGFCITGFQLYQNSKDGEKNKVRENLAAKLGSLCVILTLQVLWQKSKTSYVVQIVSVSHAGHLLPPAFSNHTTRLN